MTEESKTAKLRPMRKDEVQALETVLSYLNMEAEFNHWVDYGEPDRHIWLEVRALLDYVKTVKPDTALNYPKLAPSIKLVPALPYDNEVLTND